MGGFSFDREIMNEFGSLGMLGCTIDGYGCSGMSYGRHLAFIA